MCCHRILLCNQLIYQLRMIFHKTLDWPYWLLPFFLAVLWSHLSFKLVFLFLLHIIKLNFDFLGLTHGLTWSPSCIGAVEWTSLNRYHLWRHRSCFPKLFFQFSIYIHKLGALIEISLSFIFPSKFFLKLFIKFWL